MSADPAFGGSAQEDTAWCRVDEMVAESRTSFRSYLVGNWFVESCDGADCRNGSIALENGFKNDQKATFGTDRSASRTSFWSFLVWN